LHDAEEGVAMTALGLPGDRVIAEGREAVITHLKGLGEPDFGIDVYLHCPEGTEWSGGIVLEPYRSIPEDEVWTTTYRGGVFRIEAGPGDVYFADDDEDDVDEGHGEPTARLADSPGRNALIEAQLGKTEAGK
jgi:hypothetical protein